MIKYMNLVGKKARKAFEQKIDTKIKNKVLNKYAELLGNEKKLILKQNLKDANYARKIGIKNNLISRLLINETKFFLPSSVSNGGLTVTVKTFILNLCFKLYAT